MAQHDYDARIQRDSDGDAKPDDHSNANHDTHTLPLAHTVAAV